MGESPVWWFDWIEGRGFELHQILDGNVVKDMPGSISAPNSGSFNN